jgi:hypothetical protein
LGAVEFGVVDAIEVGDVGQGKRDAEQAFLKGEEEDDDQQHAERQLSTLPAVILGVFGARFSVLF